MLQLLRCSPLWQDVQGRGKSTNYEDCTLVMTGLEILEPSDDDNLIGLINWSGFCLFSQGPGNKSLNFIFLTTYVIPESLKVSHWLNESESFTLKPRVVTVLRISDIFILNEHPMGRVPTKESLWKTSCTKFTGWTPFIFGTPTRDTAWHWKHPAKRRGTASPKWILIHHRCLVSADAFRMHEAWNSTKSC